MNDLSSIGHIPLIRLLIVREERLFDIKTHQVVSCLMCFGAGMSAFFIKIKNKEEEEEEEVSW